MMRRWDATGGTDPAHSTAFRPDFPFTVYRSPFTQFYRSPFTQFYRSPFTQFYRSPFTQFYRSPFTQLKNK
jgi:hypothetical protein